MPLNRASEKEIALFFDLSRIIIRKAGKLV